MRDKFLSVENPQNHIIFGSKSERDPLLFLKFYEVDSLGRLSEFRENILLSPNQNSKTQFRFNSENYDILIPYMTSQFIISYDPQKYAKNHSEK